MTVIEDKVVAEKKVHSVKFLSTVKKLQQVHGLRHGDYQRYRSYCTRRVQRLRRSLHLPQGDRRHFKKRPITENHLDNERAIHIPLMLAERAWSFAMQLRLEANTERRKKFHVASRLRKAVQHATELQQLCDNERFDACTKLEAEAYVAWMYGTLFFELRVWKEATEHLKKAQIIYEKLAATSSVEEDTFFYNQRLEELTPSIRYCVYNIGDDTAIEELLQLRAQAHGDLLKNIDILMAQANETGTTALSETEWLGKPLTVKSEKVKVFLVSNRDLERTFNQHTLEQNTELLEQHLMDCKDAISVIQEETKGEAASKTPTSPLQHLLSYLTYIKLSRTVQRNKFLAEAASKNLVTPFELSIKKPSGSEEKSNARYIARLYELSLQHVSEMEQIPGVKEDTHLKNSLQMQKSALSAFRCYYVGMELVALQHWNMAIAIYDEALRLAKEALQLKNVDSALSEEVEQLVRKIKNDKYTTVAFSVLGGSDGIVQDESKTGPNKPFYKMNPLGDISHLLNDRAASGAICPNLKPLPFKPLFFDLVNDKIKIPLTKGDVTQEKKVVAGTGLTGLVKGIWGWGGSKN